MNRVHHWLILLSPFSVPKCFRCFLSMEIDVNNREEMLQIVKSCIGTKIISKWSDMACNIALDAVSTVALEDHGRREIDIKRYAKVEKVNYAVSIPNPLHWEMLKIVSPPFLYYCDFYLFSVSDQPCQHRLLQAINPSTNSGHHCQCMAREHLFEGNYGASTN